MTHPRLPLLPVSAFLSVLSIPMLAQAAFIDDLNNTNNLIVDNTGSSITTLDDNSGSGSVLFQRDTTASDTLVDWRESQTGFFDLSTENQFILTPDADGTSNQGSYNVNLLFFDVHGAYSGEIQVIADTNSTSTQTIDVAATAASLPGENEALWYARIRLVNGPGAFEFDSISAIPEPSYAMLACLSGACALFRRRVKC